MSSTGGEELDVELGDNEDELRCAYLLQLQDFSAKAIDELSVIDQEVQLLIHKEVLGNDEEIMIRESKAQAQETSQGLSVTRITKSVTGELIQKYARAFKDTLSNI